MRWIVIGFILLFHLGCKDKDARYLFADTVSLATPMVESTSLFSSPTIDCWQRPCLLRTSCKSFTKKQGKNYKPRCWLFLVLTKLGHYKNLFSRVIGSQLKYFLWVCLWQNWNGHQSLHLLILKREYCIDRRKTRAVKLS